MYVYRLSVYMDSGQNRFLLSILFFDAPFEWHRHVSKNSTCTEDLEWFDLNCNTFFRLWIMTWSTVLLACVSVRHFVMECNRCSPCAR